MLENVTIIIPAHNRPERLQRLLYYYSGTGAHILVPDSSDKPYTGPLYGEHTTYLHRPRVHMLVKVREVLPLITTPYVLYCADDDFAVPAGIAKVTRFLDANPDFASAQGHYLTFTPHDNGRVKFLPRYIRNFDCRITCDDTLRRMELKKGMYASILYGVVRAEVFSKLYSYCFDAGGELRFRNLFLAEEFFNLAVLILGRYATVPCFFSAREQIKGSATETTVPLEVIKTDPAYRDDFEGFIKSLAMLLADHDGMPLEHATELIRAISLSPRDHQSVTFKRRINSFLSRHRMLHWAARLSEWRYRQKGLQAVRHLPSYPCKHPTPDTEAIVAAVNHVR